MRTGLIARKLGMSSMFTEKGERITLTLLKVDSCHVIGHKTIEKNGYNALLIGAKEITKTSNLTKPMREFFAKSQNIPKAILKEFRIEDNKFIDIGTELKPDHFAVGQFVDVTGTTIGKGFAGAMKRWNFRGLEASHGVSVSHRSHGSTGGRQDPGKVFKNKKMAGHLGSEKVTIQNLKIVEINIDNGIIMISGNIPGHKGSFIVIKDAIKKTIKA